MTVEYYNDFVGKLLLGWEQNDPRVLAAIELACSVVKPDNRVLDVGCGIGWTSSAVAERCGANVVGVDSSPAMIETARGRFSGPGTMFRVGDFLEMRGRARYDVILMLDVFEHIARELRPRVHRQLVRLLAPKGIVVLTTPTPGSTRQVLDAGVAQPVDEFVYLGDLGWLTRVLGGIMQVEAVAAGGHSYWHAVIRT